jgi:hypothetical protein
MEPNFAIVTRDCHGFQYYKKHNIPYNVPTIGNCMRIPDFVKYIKHLNNLHNFKLNIIDEIGLRYFVGIIEYDDCCIRVHFQHDTDKHLAYKKWIRRSERLKQYVLENKKLYIFFNDVDVKECNKPFWSYVEELLNIELDCQLVIFCSLTNFTDITNNIRDDELKRGIYVILPANVNNGPDIFKFVNDNKIFSCILNSPPGKVF